MLDGALGVVSANPCGYEVEPSPMPSIGCMPRESCTHCIRGHELLPWQDLRYAPGHPSKEEQGLRIDEGSWNRWLEGLPTLIGVPKSAGTRDFVCTEDAGFVFTGPFELTAWLHGVPDEYETD